MPKVSLQDQQQSSTSVSLSYLDCLDVSQTHSPELAYFVNWTEATYKDKTFQVNPLWQVSFIMKTQVGER